MKKRPFIATYTMLFTVIISLTGTILGSLPPGQSAVAVESEQPFGQYAQQGDHEVVVSERCMRKKEYFSFEHLYCLANAPYRMTGPTDGQILNLIDAIPDQLEGYNSRTRTRTPFFASIPSDDFHPYARKLFVTEDKTIFVWSDVHGAAFSFFKSLDRLYHSGTLDNNFKIQNPNIYMVFLGDYCDRGYRNIVTLYTILRLANENPDQVILLRGNHETTEDLGGTSLNLAQEYAVFSSAKEFTDIKPLLNTFYNLLPAVLFLGNRLPDGTIDYLQLNHGAIELGMDVHDFLEDPTQECYRIMLNRHQALTQLVPTNKHRFFEHFMQLDQNNPFSFGLIWADFCTRRSYFSLPPLGIRPCYGRQLTRAWLDYQTRSIPKTTISSIVRGHQHSPPPHLGDTLALNQGAIKSWEGLVYTIIASGEPLGQATTALINEKLFFSSWLQIVPTTNPTQPWNIQHCLVSYTPADGWHLTVQPPQNAPAGSVDLCAPC